MVLGSLFVSYAKSSPDYSYNLAQAPDSLTEAARDTNVKRKRERKKKIATVRRVSCLRPSPARRMLPYTDFITRQ